MKTIGVLGGLGPQATMDFEARVHRVAQRLVPRRGIAGYPPLVVWYFREPPLVAPTADAMPEAMAPANPALLDAARRLGQWADFLVIPANGVHLWQREIAAAAGRPVLSMVDAALAEVRRRGWSRVGLVDFRPPALSVYGVPLHEAGVALEVVPAAWHPVLWQVHLAVCEGRAGAAERRVVREGIRDLYARRVDGVLLGCTEFPLVLDASDLTAGVIDPLDHLAEAAVRAAIV
jgi:aspartate racemase